MQSRGLGTRSLGALFHKMNNDLMTINGFEPSRRVSSLLKGLIKSSGNKGQFCFISPKKCNWNWPPLPFLYVSQCNIATSKLFAHNYQTPLPIAHCRFKTFKFYHCCKATAKIYYLSLKSTCEAYPLLPLQFGMHKVTSEINTETNTE